MRRIIMLIRVAMWLCHWFFVGDIITLWCAQEVIVYITLTSVFGIFYILLIILLT